MTPCPDQSAFQIIRLDETGSTNNYLKELCRGQEVEEFTVVTTENQPAGRGQRGNSWESEPGKNLTFSLLLRPEFIYAKEQFLMSQIISLSIKEELDGFAAGFSIKWPNDIYWNDLKICGILIENSLWGKAISECIIGAGINVNQQQFVSSAPNPVSLLQITGHEHDRRTILDSILARFGHYYQLLKNEQTEIIIRKYHHSLYRKNGFHTYEDRNGIFSAEIIRILPDGTLMLRDKQGQTKTFAFKEVAFVACSNPV